MAKETVATQSRVHRFEVDDRVVYTHDGHDELAVQSEGVVQSFENDEMTYLSVVFDDGKTFVVTEDELRRLPE